jgi:anhydro-N-acetylmuramic acid kinase
LRVVGVMSGTSLDGIDVAIVDIRGKRIEPVAFRSIPYPAAVRQALLNLSSGLPSVGEVSRLNFLLGELYADAIVKTCRRSSVPLESVQLIGLHGQTIYHEGGVHTLQIGEAAVVAARTGIDVISNFREADIAAGGQGAPLVPYVDYLLFRHPRKNRVALNIGGIANITVIPRGAPASEVVAFDTGPGNMVIDALVAHMTRGKQRFDRNGRIANSGKIHEEMVLHFSDHPYLKRWPPKTCGREQFGSEFVNDLLSTGLSFPDLIATATEFTAYAIVCQIFRTIEPDEIIVSGGGLHNRWLMRRLRYHVTDAELTTSAEFGIDPDAKEAIAFAVLAHESARRRPGNLPSATGARHPVVLGKRSYSRSQNRIS